MAITILTIAAKMSAMIITFAHLIWTASALPIDASTLENEISALTNAVTALDSRSEFWESAMPWFTALVVIGLLGDLVVIIWERREEVHARRRWVRQGFNPAELPSPWKLALESLSTAAILIGVALELWAGVEIAAINIQSRAKNGELRDKSIRLVALINEHANALGKDMAQLQLENTRLRAVVQPRTIKPEDREAIANALRQFSPSLKGRKVKIESQIGDGETMLMALEVADILRRANIEFDPSGMGRTSWVGAVFMGVRVTGSPADKPFISKFATKLSVPLNGGVIAEWGPKYKELAVEVGVKPIVGIPREWLRPTP